MTFGLILTWLFWPPLAAYFFWRGPRPYAWISTGAPVVLSALLYGMHRLEPDTPLFLALFVHGIVISRLIAEAFGAQKT